MTRIYRNHLILATSVLLLLSCQTKQDKPSAKISIPAPEITATDSVNPAYPAIPGLSADGNCDEYNSISDLIAAYEMIDNAARLPPGWLQKDLSLPDTAKGYFKVVGENTNNGVFLYSFKLKLFRVSKIRRTSPLLCVYTSKQ